MYIRVRVCAHVCLNTCVMCINMYLCVHMYNVHQCVCAHVCACLCICVYITINITQIEAFHISWKFWICKFSKIDVSWAEDFRKIISIKNFQLYGSICSYTQGCFKVQVIKLIFCIVMWSLVMSLYPHKFLIISLLA